MALSKWQYGIKNSGKIILLLNKNGHVMCGQYTERISIYGCCIWMHDMSVYVSDAKEFVLPFDMLLYGVYSLRDSDVS